MVPTKENMEAWIEQSKVFGASLNNKAASLNQSPTRVNSLTFSNFGESNPYDAIEIDPRMRSMGRSDEPISGRKLIAFNSD